MAVKRGAKIIGATVLVEGQGFIGQTAEVELPVIEFDTFEQKNSIAETTYTTPMLKKMEATIKLAKFNTGLLTSVNKFLTSKSNIICKWVEAGDTNNLNIATLRGDIMSTKTTNIKVGNDIEFEIKMCIHFYGLVINDVNEYLIDVENMVCEVGGVDRWADLKSFLEV